MKKFLKIASVTLLTAVLAYGLYIVIGLRSFSRMADKELILTLNEKGNRYEVYYVWGGATMGAYRLESTETSILILQ